MKAKLPLAQAHTRHGSFRQLSLYRFRRSDVAICINCGASEEDGSIFSSVARDGYVA